MPGSLGLQPTDVILLTCTALAWAVSATGLVRRLRLGSVLTVLERPEHTLPSVVCLFVIGLCTAKIASDVGHPALSLAASSLIAFALIEGVLGEVQMRERGVAMGAWRAYPWVRIAGYEIVALPGRPHSLVVLHTRPAWPRDSLVAVSLRCPLRARDTVDTLLSHHVSHGGDSRRPPRQVRPSGQPMARRDP